MSKSSIHPGLYIKANVIPSGLSVKEAAKLLDVGRPALSNLLNGNAALSSEMALRIEKVFGYDRKKLLQLQANFEQQDLAAREKTITVRSYVPTLFSIKAKEIESWVDDNISARTLLAVLIRKLIYSTGNGIISADFPGYDNAERKGVDGKLETTAATPWIPLGKSIWEFGCNKDYKKKAEKDYNARVKMFSENERSEINYIFVTPRRWDGKAQWAQDKENLGEWKSVKAYDSNDLEQWLEQSIPAQSWLAEQIGIPAQGIFTLEECWNRWSSATEPKLSKDIFEPSIASHKGQVLSWLKDPSLSPLIVSADSRDEALAFLACIFETEDLREYKDRVLVFSSVEAIRKIAKSSLDFISIPFSEEIAKELGGLHKKSHTIIVRPRNTADSNPHIALDLLNYNVFEKALSSMGLSNEKINSLARKSGFSPTILRRRLSNNPAIRTPAWAKENSTVKELIPMMFVGAWHARSKGDCEVLSCLSNSSYEDVEHNITDLLNFEDSPVWSIGRVRGVASKIDSFFAVQHLVTEKNLNDFFFVAEVVLSENDPALDLPEENRWAADLYGKSRDHSDALRNGICETLVILSIHGNQLFKKRLGVDIEARVETLIRRLLTPLTPVKLFSHNNDLPSYAEAAPLALLEILEEDMRNPKPEIYELLKPAGNGIFSGCPRSGLLWALENIAWKSAYLVRVCTILAKFSELKIDDNWVNKPVNSLFAIFRWWMPQTAASLEERKAALDFLIKTNPAIGWKICADQINRGTQMGHRSHRPRWRSDATGAGEPGKTPEHFNFLRYAADIILNWNAHNKNTLADLIDRLECFSSEDQNKIWDMVDAWAKNEGDENSRCELREKIRISAFTRRGIRRGLNESIRDRARECYASLEPKDLITKNKWLFSTHWVEASYGEIQDEDFDFREHEERVKELRIAALSDIWQSLGFVGIQRLLTVSEAPSSVGFHLANGVITESEAERFLNDLFNIKEESLLNKINDLIGGFLLAIDKHTQDKLLLSLTKKIRRPDILRLLISAPFSSDTWKKVDSVDAEMRSDYWRKIWPRWGGLDAKEVNELIDRLLDVRRPRTAFKAVHFALDQVETSRLKKLLQSIGLVDLEQDPTRVDSYDISATLNILEKRSGVTQEEMANLEFIFIRALDHSEHGIPNLERQLGKSPDFFMQVIALAYKRNDDGEDPPEWKTNINNAEAKEAMFSSAFSILNQIKYIPGTDENGEINAAQLKKWLTEVRSLCAKYARKDIGDQTLGKILSRAPIDKDGIFPCVAVREALEEINSSNISEGFQIGVYNNRGVHVRGEGGAQERELAEKHRIWSRKLAFEYPYVASVLEGIAASYDREAEWQDSEALVRRRLSH